MSDYSVPDNDVEAQKKIIELHDLIATDLSPDEIARVELLQDGAETIDGELVASESDIESTLGELGSLLTEEYGYDTNSQAMRRVAELQEFYNQR